MFVLRFFIWRTNHRIDSVKKRCYLLCRPELWQSSSELVMLAFDTFHHQGYWLFGTSWGGTELWSYLQGVVNNINRLDTHAHNSDSEWRILLIRVFPYCVQSHALNVLNNKEGRGLNYWAYNNSDQYEYPPPLPLPGSQTMRALYIYIYKLYKSVLYLIYSKESFIRTGDCLRFQVLFYF